MGFLKDLGFDPVLLGAQVLNFLIIYYLLKRFLYKPVMDMIKSREDKIAEGLKQAEESRTTLEKTLEEETKILQKAEIQAQKIIEDAKEQALDASRQIDENAKQEADRIILAAREKIEQESRDTEARLTQKISLIASDMVAKSLEGLISEKEQKQILEKTLHNIKNVN
ncbi:F0F1 ATP synthase subunit B [Patescibacteria group bacterium]|nr:F0F1 ATP synthase subunit B [Patescibacteria group bacterium]